MEVCLSLNLRHNNPAEVKFRPVVFSRAKYVIGIIKQFGGNKRVLIITPPPSKKRFKKYQE